MDIRHPIGRATRLRLASFLVRLVETEVQALVKFLCGAQLAVDELVKGVVQLSPSTGKIASLDKVCQQRRVKGESAHAECALVKITAVWRPNPVRW